MFRTYILKKVNDIYTCGKPYFIDRNNLDFIINDYYYSLLLFLQKLISYLNLENLSNKINTIQEYETYIRHFTGIPTTIKSW